MERIKSYAEEINQIHLNPYFISLSKQDFPLTKFLQSQEGFIEAVNCWTHVLCKLVFILPSDQERIPVIMNLYDEHGEGNPQNTHIQTFTRFLQNLGYIGKIEIGKASPSHRICRNFTSALNKSFEKADKDYQYMSALLGMIEYTYITVSHNIHLYAVGFVDAKDIEHYSLHEILDTKHSEDLFRLCLDKEGRMNDDDQERVFSGMKEGYDIFYTLYSELASITLPTTTSE